MELLFGDFKIYSSSLKQKETTARRMSPIRIAGMMPITLISKKCTTEKRTARQEREIITLIRVVAFSETRTLIRARKNVKIRFIALWLALLFCILL